MSYCDKCGKELKENEVCDCTESLNEFKNQYENVGVQVSEPKSRIGNYLTAIIYPLLFVILALFLLSIDETSIIGVIVAVVMDIAAAVFILMGGYYFLIIPLPYIFIWRGGCTKPELPTWKKIVFAIAAIVLLFGSVAVLFLFSTI